jgi:hypothetical protein
MEATKWLKPLVERVTLGDLASVQAVTRVNAEQTSKTLMRRPTRPPLRGRLARPGKRAKKAPGRFAGVWATACTQGGHAQHGKPLGGVRGSPTGSP